MSDHATTETPTIESLMAMDENAFRCAVTDDMHLVREFNGPFQSREVIERTLLALIDSLWQTNYLIDDRAEDPNCSPELYQRTVKYRAHLLSVIDITERRHTFQMGLNARAVSRWKAVLHEVIDAIINGKDDSEILAMQIPNFKDAEVRLNLETWWEVRRAKDPRRVEAQKAAA